MSDIVKNTVQNIVYPFYIKGNDFKELSIKAKDIKEWIIKNGQELKDFIFRHRNHYALNNYQEVHLNDMPRTISKVDIVFREPLEKIKAFKDDLNKIRNNIISLEKVLENNKIEIKNDMIQAQKYKQKQFIKEQEEIKNERIEFANNLKEDIGLDMDQIQDEQVRAMEDVAEIDKKMEKVVSKFRKDKLKNDQIIIKGFKKEISAFDLFALLEKDLILLNEKEIKNIVKKQYEENNFLGISGIEIEVQK
ncbi:hypothetical protein [Spiroplasma melliferum]|uniref:Uncharacterized protein n=2 Tax=Spiroplasma melliferum TaxID=2134 RepID=A0AAI9T4X2_SPIME|nr:hypothetical protein [Spiroplasma melliferum]KAI93166.1 hypothetical protein SPM_002875 [Spiroplasma melliferum KC3]QCO23323.1 hypothetical protein SRED_001786 [Spiroplasma melliferum]QCO23889.1 hypothetical protein SRED_002369 [Spiroplasma melliferum]